MVSPLPSCSIVLVIYVSFNFNLSRAGTAKSTIRQILFFFFFVVIDYHLAFREATYPVDGIHFGRPWCDERFRSDVSCHWIYLWPKGEVPLGFNTLRRGWVYHPVPEAPLLQECRRGPRHFWKCQARVGFGPAPGPTLIKDLCHIRPVGETEDKYHHLVGSSDQD